MIEAEFELKMMASIWDQLERLGLEDRTRILNWLDQKSQSQEYATPSKT